MLTLMTKRPCLRTHMRMLVTLGLGFLAICSCSRTANDTPSAVCKTGLLVLGTGQDAGKPQIGVHDDPAWRDPARRALASSIALLHYPDKPPAGQTAIPPDIYLFDATPDIKEQLYRLEKFLGEPLPPLSGVFITHAHIGHYLGLAQFGREAMGANGVTTYVMARMKDFLTHNGPWSQLVKLENITLQEIAHNVPTMLDENLAITPFLVPHRDEYAETVGYQIKTENQQVIFLPDIDSWNEWSASGREITDVIQENTQLFLDASFFSGDELPGRDMSKIPHPTIVSSMDRFANLSDDDKNKVHFIHMNHTNPALDPSSQESRTIERKGFHVAREGDFHCLD